MDKPSLIEALQSLIAQDPVLRQQWSLRADIVLGMLDHKALKKRITAAFLTKYRYIRLRAPLLKRAEVTDDLPAMLALYQKTASDERDCLDAAKRCIAHEAWDELETWLARAKQAASREFPHQQVERQRLELRLYLQRGEEEAAAALQWEIYQSTRKLGDYRQMVKLATEHDLVVDYRRRAHDWLVDGLDKTPQLPFGSGPRMVDSLLEIYLFEGRLDEAQALCAERAVSPTLLHQLAQALKAPDESLLLYLRLVRHEVQQTNNQGYRDGIALLRELQGRLETAPQRDAFEAALAQLRSEFKQKRNFIKWLNQAFPG